MPVLWLLVYTYKFHLSILCIRDSHFKIFWLSSFLQSLQSAVGADNIFYTAIMVFHVTYLFLIFMRGSPISWGQKMGNVSGIA